MVGGKRPFFVMDPFCTPHSVCLNIGFSLNILFWFIVLWTKKLSFSFFKKVLVFQRTFFKVNILKTFKIPCDCHIKPCSSLKRRALLKIPRINFYRSTRSFYWFQNKTSAKKRFSVLRWKHFAVKLVYFREAATIFLSTRWIFLFKYLLS